MYFKKRIDAIELTQFTNEYLSINEVCIAQGLDNGSLARFLSAIGKLYYYDAFYCIKKTDMYLIKAPDGYFKLTHIKNDIPEELAKELSKLARRGLVKSVKIMGVNFYCYEDILNLIPDNQIKQTDNEPITLNYRKKAYCAELAKEFETMPKEFKQEVYDRLNLIPSLRLI